MDSFSAVTELSKGKTFTKDVFIFNCLRKSEGKTKLLFDTGASRTGICKSVLIEYGYENFNKDSTKRQTVNGLILMDRCILRTLRLKGFQQLENFEIDVIDSNFRGFQGILGMDIILMLETWISNSRSKAYCFGNYTRLKEEVNATFSKSNFFT